jgi:hypothetical protein
LSLFLLAIAFSMRTLGVGAGVGWAVSDRGNAMRHMTKAGMNLRD